MGKRKSEMGRKKQEDDSVEGRGRGGGKEGGEGGKGREGGEGRRGKRE